MSERVSMRRPDLRLVVVRVVSVARSAWIVVGTAVGSTAVLPPAWRPVITVVLVYYAYTRVVRIVHDLLAIRYAAGPAGVRVARGLVGVEEQRFSWDAVVSVSVTQSLVERLLGIADVRVTLTASDTASDTLPGVRAGEAARLVRLHEQNRSHEPQLLEHTERSESPEPPVSPRKITPRLGPNDFVLIGISSGAFLFFVPSVYSAVSETTSLLRVPTVLPPLDALGSFPVAVLVALVAGAVVLSVGYGAVVAWLKYRAFAVEIGESGALTFTAGLASKEQRVVKCDAVAAYELRRPLLLTPVRRVVLRAVVRGDDGHITRGMLLPLARVTDGLDMLRRLTLLPSGALMSRSVRLPVVAIIVAFAIAASSGLATVAMTAGSEYFLVLTSFAILALHTVDTRVGRISVVISRDGQPWVVSNRGVFFRSTWVVRSQAVDVSGWCGVGGRWGTQTVAIRGRRTLRLSVWPASIRTALQLRRAVESSEPLTLERNTR